MDLNIGRVQVPIIPYIRSIRPTVSNRHRILNTNARLAADRHAIRTKSIDRHVSQLRPCIVIQRKSIARGCVCGLQLDAIYLPNGVLIQHEGIAGARILIHHRTRIARLSDNLNIRPWGWLRFTVVAVLCVPVPLKRQHRIPLMRRFVRRSWLR